ncbi:6643_t:CDS:10 [Entrophospora sp. SA101]|nr:13855_t:CDS:10 [Entrophospora sp. SA101]CAJ0906192.1 6643_t:CDS:10 [Entrophospora sp. SA101]CAJ0915816.1 19769_t:CDS:10 [Entrophospora sp. SA101]
MMQVNHIRTFPGSVTTNPDTYKEQYKKLRIFIENSESKFKDERQRVLWPLFVNFYLDLVSKGFLNQATEFFNIYQLDHEIHLNEINKMKFITQPQHIQEDEFVQNFRSKKYTVSMSRTSYEILIRFLQDNNTLLLTMVNQYINVEVTEEDVGSSYTDIGTSSQELELELQSGFMPMEPEFRDEVEKRLKGENEHSRAQIGNEMNGIINSTPSLHQESLNKKIKREQTIDSPPISLVPLPSYNGADLQAQVDLVKDLTQRINLGPASLPSVCFYTFYNTCNSLNCLSISDDATLIAGGFSESYINIWSLKSEKSRVLQDHVNASGINNSTDDLGNVKGGDCKKLCGHSGPIFGLSFSPDNKHLLSCSEDSTARLWSTDLYTNLVCYRGHNLPIWDIQFSPFGFYFVTASNDRTARLWSCDHIYALRIFAGHISDVDTVRFHPNSKYIFTGSNDKSIRMWDISSGSCIRIFSGHTGGITCLAVSDDGQLLASSGDDKSVILWDIASGKCFKKLIGHTETVYSLDFSKEGSILVSGSADKTVRIWDVQKGISGDSVDGDHSLSSPTTASKPKNNAEDISLLNRKSKATNVKPSRDLLTTLYSKNTPVYEIKFTRRNLCLAAGNYKSTTEDQKQKKS